MPFPRLRVFFLLLSILAFTVLTAYFSAASLYPDYDNPEETSMFSPTTSSFLFPPSAIISLTDDNNTFFISRPAAFGPSLPKHGLEGELFVLEEGQLACDDTPGWDTSATIFDLEQPPLVNPEEPDDGTDDALNPAPANDEVLNKQRTHADIESLQQSAEIEGKIVLVTRGGCGFLEKVLWAQRRGSIALIVGDYRRPGIGSGGLVTMYAKGDTSNVTIPSIFTSHTTAALLTSLLPKHPAIPLTFPKTRKPMPVQPARSGLWITLTPTTMTSSPFFDTLLVLVVSPLVTLTVVYTLLLIRSRIRRRRWRAPKSVVERLPVRTYQSASPAPSPTYPPPRDSSLLLPSGALESPTPGSPPPPQQPTPSWFERRGWSGSKECVVCLEEYVDGVSRVMKLPCGHEFHAECITPWLTTRRRTCPICKGDVVRGCKAAEQTGGFPSVDETTPLVLAPDSSDDEDLERR